MAEMGFCRKEFPDRLLSSSHRKAPGPGDRESLPQGSCLLGPELIANWVP